MSPHRFSSHFSTTLALCVAAVVACGGRSSDIPSGTRDDGGTSTGLASGDMPDAALPPGVAFMDGNIKCCEQGLGQTCCSPHDKELGACVESRGCTPAGQGISGKDVCSICCGGMGVIFRMSLVDGKCVSDDTHPEEEWICAACGDGVCNTSAGENVCNCAADCGKP
jgi:hypothetical protein